MTSRVNRVSKPTETVSCELKWTITPITSTSILRQISFFLTLAGIDYVFYSRYRDGRLGDVGSKDTFPGVCRGGRKYSSLLRRRQGSIHWACKDLDEDHNENESYQNVIMSYSHTLLRESASIHFYRFVQTFDILLAYTISEVSMDDAVKPTHIPGRNIRTSPGGLSVWIWKNVRRAAST